MIEGDRSRMPLERHTNRERVWARVPLLTLRTPDTHPQARCPPHPTPGITGVSAFAE